MRKAILTLLLVSLAAACDDEYNSPIPHYDVRLELNLNTLDNDLIPVLAAKVFTAPRTSLDRLGYGGLLIINGIGSGTDFSGINLYAYDLACPNEAKPNIRVVPDSDGLRAVCPHCGAVFSIAYGTGNPESGAKHFLRAYKVYKTGEYNYLVAH
ncbi:MAG: zinc ribbon domain-containing protein [Dysgonamonadaceae bacterium]|jgi:hypothetical protein|nr:zinc ribbon domain-containing protein [Dysgonamonadaceae bacterium]